MVFMKNPMKCLKAMRSIATQSRWLCAIAIAAVLGFSFAACEQPVETAPPTLTGITADYTQGSTIIYPTTPTDSLKAGLTVTANYSDGDSKTLDSTEYTLSNRTLTVGINSVTVYYADKTTAFIVTVTAAAITYTATQTGGADKTDDSNGADTIGINFTFSAAVSGLTADDITVTNGTGEVTAGNLSGGGISWSLAVTVTTAGNVTVSITKTGIEAETKHVTVYKEGETAPAIATSSLPDGFIGIEYSETITSAGGGITWSIVNGALPAGLTLSTGGVISGKPTTAESSTFTVEAANEAGSDTKSFSITITDEAIPLTENIWADGSIPTSSDVQWFTFTATASTQYIHVEYGTLYDLYVHVYNSSGTAVGSETNLWGVFTGNTSRSLTTGQTYYIRVMPYNRSGAYRIGFTASTTAPNRIQIPSNAIPLTENIWADGNLPTGNDVPWFTFTATAFTQWIHIETGALSSYYGIYVQVYDSSGAAVDSETNLYGSNVSTSRSLTTGDTYYIKLRPYGNYSGTYRITFNTSIAPPGIDNPIPLVENQWADGSLLTSSDVQWFTFTATAAMQWIHIETGTLTQLYVQVYDSSGAASGSETSLSGSTASASRTLTTEQTYYIRVKPYSSGYSGAYRIGFTASIAPPGAIPLTVNEWADGSLPTSSDVQWFTFTATVAAQYIHVEYGTLTNLYVNVYDSSGATVESETRLYSLLTSASRTLTAGQTYYIRVRSYSSDYSGAYRIRFNTSPQWPPIARSLTANWANGSISTPGSQEWYTFTATASTQWIHASFGTLSSMSGIYVQVYDSSGAMSGSEINLDDILTSISRSLTTGQTYYIRVRSSANLVGTYKIALTTSIAPPGAITLTENQWTNGSLPTSSDVQWFVFTATASTQWIHIETYMLARLYVDVYNSSGAMVGGETLSGSTTASASRTLTTGQTYYISVKPYSSGYSVNYRIGFTASIALPGAIQLTENQWADGNIPTSGGVPWFTFTAAESTQYIHIEPGTLTDLYVQVYDSSSETVGSETRLYGFITSASRSLSIGQKYYIRVKPTNINGSGAYRIGFNTSIVPPINPIPLTVNQWAGGNIPTSSDVQWFTFTATASTQYIHFESGTLNDLYVQVYDSSNTTVGNETRLYYATTSTSRSLSIGQTYYIRVRPYYGSAGAYRIGFTTSTTAPTS
jgi:hypothetical protein